MITTEYIEGFLNCVQIEFAYAVGDKVTFVQQYGSWVGKWTGKILRRLMPNPHGYMNSPITCHNTDNIGALYEIEVFIPAPMWGNYTKMLIAPKSILGRV